MDINTILTKFDNNEELNEKEIGHLIENYSIEDERDDDVYKNMRYVYSLIHIKEKDRYFTATWRECLSEWDNIYEDQPIEVFYKGEMTRKVVTTSTFNRYLDKDGKNLWTTTLSENEEVIEED